ncbi:MAG TPA: DegQ family serine endoprotease, partial [bacterium]|nr:DegQ family serine endoprotease [bacterium]
PAQGSSSVARALSDEFATVAREVNPSVVTIFTETAVQSRAVNPFQGTPFEQFFENQQPQGSYKQMGLGSGVIFNAGGTIITNNHVVENADDIKVRLMDGREFKAKVKGTDPQTDIAVITIDAKNLRPLRLGNSDQARVGDWVLAIGSPLNPQLEHTVTAGIISAKGRSSVGLSQYEDYIQTDAAINPGNSGGAMVNLDGELIGINSAIVTESGGFMGIGFAIPVNLVDKIATDIIQKGRVIRGWLGVYIQDITPEIAKAMNLESTHGVVVSKVQENSPASRAGLQKGDVIVGFDGKSIENSVELSTWVSSTSPGTKITLRYMRNGKEQETAIVLAELNVKEMQREEGLREYSNLGFSISNLTPELRQKYDIPSKLSGVLVRMVQSNSLAAEYNVQEGDIITEINHQAVSSADQFDTILGSIKPGQTLLLYLQRNDANLFVAFPMPAA